MEENIFENISLLTIKMLTGSSTYTTTGKYEGLYEHHILLYKYQLPMIVKNATNSETFKCRNI